MKQQITEHIPTEIWENIFSYATSSSLLPFTENGELASSLIDTTDLFPIECNVFKKYRDDTQVTIGRLRLVCRSWASILQCMVNELTYTDLIEYYFPSQYSGYAKYLWAGTLPNCEQLHSCTFIYPPWRFQRQELNGYKEENLLRMCSSSLKILVWAIEKLDPPVGILGNLRAFSLATPNISSTFSLRQLFSSAPNLSHLRLQISQNDVGILSQEVHATSLLWLKLGFDVYMMGYHSPKFMPWTFPRLRALHLTGFMNEESKPELERFLSQHSKSITELDIHEFDYCKESIWLTPVMSLSLWKVCPHVETLRVKETTMFRLAEEQGTNGKQVPDVSIPRLNLILARYSGLTKRLLEQMALLKNVLNIKKIIYSEPWAEVMIRDNSVMFQSRVDLKQKVQELLKRLEPLDVLIVDIFEEPLSKFYQRLVEDLKHLFLYPE
ncbi:hypothetical protein CPB86DRAFT_788839 [Serendipita vermifera]|nr:hypothetical protein CPB86DRAFT_788839 [Serendipita vermifera]